MPTNHEAVAAWPVGANADKEAIRAMETRRFAYCLGDDENAGDLKVIDPASGVKPLYLIQRGVLFQLDDDDTTTDAGATCLVSNDGKRYKSDAVGIPFSVLDKDTSAQPASPSVGDRYIIPTGATGTDWSGKDGKVGEYTERGWIFSTIPIGRSVYVRDENAFYYRNDSGVWTAGFGSIGYTAGSIPITAIIGAKASFVIKVENATTTSPPSSPVAPVAYIVSGASWSGFNAGDLAICLVNGTFTRIIPATGDTVYNKALAINVRWNGTAWESAAGAVVGFATTGLLAASQSGGLSGSNRYTYSTSTAPTSAQQIRTDANTITYAAKKSGAKLLITWECVFSGSDNVSSTDDTGGNVAMLLRDSETNAIAWTLLPNISANLSNSLFNPSFRWEWEITASDTSSHTYKAAITSALDGSTRKTPRFEHRRMTVREIAS